MEEPRQLQRGGGFPIYEDLVIKILAKLPYPTIFKAKCLSKRWASFFSGDPDESDTKAFQHEVGLQATKWPSFTPLLVYENRILGYDVGMKTWQEMRLPSSGDSPMVNWIADWIREPRRCVFSGGSMICWFGERNVTRSSERVVVINILTGDFKVLYSPILANEQILDHRRLKYGRIFHAVKSGFILILIYWKREGEPYELVLQVYDSRKASWETHETLVRGQPRNISLGLGIVCPKLVEDRIVYCLFNWHWPPVFGYYDLETRTWNDIVFSDAFLQFIATENVDLKRLVSCGTRVFMVASQAVDRVDGASNHKLFLLEYIANSGSFTKTEPECLIRTESETCDIENCSSDSDHIYLHRCNYEPFDLEIHAYSLREREWSTVSVPVDAFEGLANIFEGFQWAQNSLSPGFHPFFNPSSLPD